MDDRPRIHRPTRRILLKLAFKIDPLAVLVDIHVDAFTIQNSS
jgi:hypothetical protein